MRTIISAMLVVLLITGCATAKEDDMSLRLGMSQAEISSQLKGSGTHQFSAQKDSNAFYCVSYSFCEHHLICYFLFMDGKLVSILDRHPFFAEAFETKPYLKYPGSKIEIRKPWKDEDFMMDIIKAKTMSPEALSALIKTTELEEAKRAKTIEVDNLLPLFVILAPLAPFAISQNIYWHMKHEAWLNKYDLFKIGIGAKRSNVEAVYGSPSFVVKHSDTNRATHAYGPPELLWRGKTCLYLGTYFDNRFWTAVVYENDVAVRIFSNDLFNHENIMSLQNEVK